jgi:hypothetical protein
VKQKLMFWGAAALASVAFFAVLARVYPSGVDLIFNRNSAK